MLLTLRLIMTTIHWIPFSAHMVDWPALPSITRLIFVLSLATHTLIVGRELDFAAKTPGAVMRTEWLNGLQDSPDIAPVHRLTSFGGREGTRRCWIIIAVYFGIVIFSDVAGLPIFNFNSPWLLASYGAAAILLRLALFLAAETPAAGTPYRMYIHHNPATTCTILALGTFAVVLGACILEAPGPLAGLGQVLLAVGATNLIEIVFRWILELIVNYVRIKRKLLRMIGLANHFEKTEWFINMYFAESPFTASIRQTVQKLESLRIRRGVVGGERMASLQIA